MRGKRGESEGGKDERKREIGLGDQESEGGGEGKIKGGESEGGRNGKGRREGGDSQGGR